MIAYIKLSGILALVVMLFGGGFYYGSMRSKTALERLQRDQAQNTATAVLAERAAGAVELARRNAKLKEFEDAKDVPDPVVTGIVNRVFLRANSSGCAVSSAGTTASGTSPASGVPRGDPTLERLSQEAADAAGRDAARLNLCRDTWQR